MKNKISNKVVLALIGSALFGVSTAAAGTVGILGSTVAGGLESPEALAAVALGHDVELIDNKSWFFMTKEEFEAYDALVLGDPYCTEETTPVKMAELKPKIWASAVSGNVIVIGADPTWHSFPPAGIPQQPGAQTLIESGMEFALDKEGTGAYITLSCYYQAVPYGTPVDFLSGFGDFTVTGAYTTGALNDVHIVASHPVLDGVLEDEDLSGWNNSVHENFETWPGDFDVLATALHPDGSHTAGDGSVGYPYIVARGVDPLPTPCAESNVAMRGIILTRNWETDRDQAQFKMRKVSGVKAAAYNAVETDTGLTFHFGACDDPTYSFTIPGTELNVTYLNLRYTVGNVDVVRCVFSSEQCVVNIKNTDLDNAALDELLTGDMTVSLRIGDTNYTKTGVYTQYESGSGSWTKYRQDKW